MNGYQTAFQDQDDCRPGNRGPSGSQSYGITGAFIHSLAPAYPSITDELKKDVAILTSSLRIRDYYIEKLRKARDSLASKLDFNLMQMESLENQMKSYQEFFQKNKGTRTYQ